jgi:hypothetical protein
MRDALCTEGCWPPSLTTAEATITTASGNSACQNLGSHAYRHGARQYSGAGGQAVQASETAKSLVVGLRNFVQRSSPRPMESQLDWFQIGMKLELLRRAVVMPGSLERI